MTLTTVAATAATCEVVPGIEQTNAEGMLNIKGRIFTDIVESQDSRMAGTNRPTLNLILNPESGEGEIWGTFKLKPKKVDATWEGELQGRIVNGFVSASGVARGSGALEGSVMRIDFQQVAEYPSKPPCDNPQAFFEMKGIILE